MAPSSDICSILIIKIIIKEYYENNFITGASGGLGKATAKLFQSQGWRVIATMRNPETETETETELNKLENVTILVVDLTKPDMVQSTVKDAIEQSDIDVVLNNAD